jgi:hypothetical protein
MKPWIRIMWAILLCSPSLCDGQTGRYRIMCYDDPATSMVLGFQVLDGSPKAHFVYYDTVDHGLDTSLYAFRSAVTDHNEFAGMKNAFARLNGLSPNTAYYFVIADTAAVSRRLWFMTTPDEPGERLSFIAGGDSRNHRTPRKMANRTVSKLRPHAVFFAGDFTYWGTDNQWRFWLDDWQLSIGADGRIIPLIPGRGNHEPSNAHLRSLFLAPYYNYYALTFGGNLFRAYALNTEMSIAGQQSNWLESDLNDHCDELWRFAFYHKPMRPHVKSKREGVNQYQHWAPLFYEHQVRLVMESDAHVVKTTWPLRPDLGEEHEEGFVIDQEKGTVYIGEGCWGAPLRLADDTKSWTRDDTSFNQLKWFFVDREAIEVRTVIIPDASTMDTILAVDDAARFQVPEGLPIWNPENGSVVRLTRPREEIRLTAPKDNSYLAEPQAIALKVEAVNQNAAIKEVRFLVNGVPQAADLASPYQWDWSAPKEGNYVLGAEMTDERGNYQRSCPVRLRIGDPNQDLMARVASCQDDAVQDALGWVETNGSGLRLQDSSTVALRFGRLAIPQGARIESAALYLQPLELGASGFKLRIKAETSDFAAPLGHERWHLEARARSQAGLNWQFRPGNPGLEKVEIKHLLAEVIQRSGWQVGNAFCLLIEVQGQGLLGSCETGQAARLEVRYSAPFREESVSLSSFSVVPWRNTYARISWQSEREIRLQQMIVERSRNGKQFVPIASREAIGGPSWDVAYEVIDSVPYYGRSYYRLQMVNQDGLQTYSPVQSLDLYPSREFFVYPNPASVSEGFHLELSSVGDTLVSVELYTLGGAVVAREKFALVPGRNRFWVQTDNFLPGLYLLRVQWAGGPLWRKVWLRD